MPCMCEDIRCPSCGPAQGFDPVLMDFTDVLFDLFQRDCPDAISLDWLLGYVAPKLLDAFPDLATMPVTPPPPAVQQEG